MEKEILKFIESSIFYNYKESKVKNLTALKWQMVLEFCSFREELGKKMIEQIISEYFTYYEDGGVYKAHFHRTKYLKDHFSWTDEELSH